MSAADLAGERPLWFVLLAADPASVAAIQRAFRDSGPVRFAGGTARARDVAQMVAENAADMLVVEEPAGRRSGLALAAELARRMPATRVFLSSRHPSPELLAQARQAGMRGVLRHPFSPAELWRAVRVDIEAERLQLDQVTADPVASAVAPTVAEGPRVLAVFSFKGGVGKTTVAVNLAVTARAGPRRRWSTVLVDADDGLGTAHVLLGAPPRPTLLSWEEYGGEPAIDPAIVGHKLVSTLRNGLHAVFSSGRADRAVGIPAMETMLTTLRGIYALTVVDCGCEVSAAVLTVLRRADVVALVVDQTLGATEKVSLGLRALAEAGVPHSKFRLLVNAVHWGPGGYRADELRAALELQVLGTLPFDAAAKAAENRREPLAGSAPGGRFMRGLVRAFDPLLPGLGGRRRWSGL